MPTPEPDGASPGAAHSLGISCPQTSVQRDAPWPMPSRCPDSSRFLPVAPLVGPHVAWSTPLAGIGLPPVIATPPGIVSADGVIHFQAGNDRFAIDADGSILSRTHDGGTPAAIGADGTLYVYDAADVRALAPDGSVRWTAATVLNNGLGTFTLGNDGVSYALGYTPEGTCSATGRVSALRPDGSTSWTVLVPCTEGNHSPNVAAPVVGSDGTLHFVSATGDADGSHVETVAPDGTVRWRNDDFAGPPMTSAPMVGPDGAAYYALPEGNGTVITRAYGPDGTRRWDTPHAGIMAARTDGDVLLLETSFGQGPTLYDLRPDGSIAWSRSFSRSSSDYGISNPIVVDGAIYVSIRCFPTNVSCTPGVTALNGNGDPLWTVGGFDPAFWMIAGKDALYSLSVDVHTGQLSLVAISD